MFSDYTLDLVLSVVKLTVSLVVKHEAHEFEELRGQRQPVVDYYYYY